MSHHQRSLFVPPPPHPPTCSRVADTCGCVTGPLAPSAYPFPPDIDGADGKIPASPREADSPAAPARPDEESSRVTAVHASALGRRLVAQADGANQRSRYPCPRRSNQVLEPCA